MCGRCRAGHLVAGDGEVYCLSCGWRRYPPRRRFRLSPRDRAQRRARVRRVALEASERGACHTCGADAVTAKALPAPPGDEQRRCAGSDAVPPRRSTLPLLRVAGGHAGLLRGTPRPPQTPSGWPASGSGAALGAAASSA